MAAAIAATNPELPVSIVHAHAAALISVFQMITDRLGRSVLDGADFARVADELAPAVTAVLDDLDDHFGRLLSRARPADREHRDDDQ